MASWRATAYELFAVLFVYPSAQRLRWLRASAAQLRRHDRAVATLGFFGAWTRLLGALETLSDPEAPVVQAEHVRLFVINPSGVPCLPYESSHLGSHGPGVGLVAPLLLAVYERAGLRLTPGSSEGPDHVAMELDFMAHLCQQEAEAWDRRDAEVVRHAIGAERAFLRDHLARWFGSFARQVRNTASLPLYQKGAEAGDAFIVHDVDLVEALDVAVGPGEWPFLT